MRRLGWSKLAAVGAGVSLMALTSGALASSGLDSPESGVEQIGRGAAWLARANDPLAAYYNPAAIAFQATSVHVGAELMFSNKCFTRTMVDPNTGQQIAVPYGAKTPSGPITPLLPGQAAPMGLELPSDTVCSSSGAFPNPQLGAVFRVADHVAIGFALVAPHSTGNATWPESLPYTQTFNGTAYPHTMPSPQRYMLTSSKALIVNPTISVAYAPMDNLSFGAGFIWGVATAEFTNFAEAIMHAQTMQDFGDHAGGNDVKATLKAKDLFIPGFVISGLWSPTSNLDVTAWYKWQDAIKGTGDLHVESLYWDPKGDTWPKVNGATGTFCNNNTDPMTMKPYAAGCNVKDQAAAGTFKLNIPMEAKLGLRYHMPRADQSNKPGWANVPGRRVRDPLSEDVFDIEADFTWANNSAVQDIELTFQTNPAIVIPQTGGGIVPKNANIPHNWKDVFGVRVGGDVVVVPNRLTLRTGGFFETQGQDAQYLQLDFDLAWKAGVGGGATVRLGPIDLSVGYQHTFWGTLDNGGKGAVYALAGDASGTVGANPVCGKDLNNPKIGPGCYRSYQAVNGGKLTASMNELGLSATARF